MRSRYTVAIHGYSGYTAGCKCAVCRGAKAAYMSERRAAARRRAAVSERVTCPEDWPTGIVRYVAFGAAHGTRSAYDEHGCRCFDCTDHARAWKASPNGATRKDVAA